MAKKGKKQTTDKQTTGKAKHTKSRILYWIAAVVILIPRCYGAIRILLYVLISIALCDACFTDWYFGVYGSQLTIYCWL